MKILILGDVMGLSGRKALKKNLSKIISKKMILIFQLSTVKMLLMMEKVLQRK